MPVVGRVSFCRWCRLLLVVSLFGWPVCFEATFLNMSLCALPVHTTFINGNYVLNSSQHKATTSSYKVFLISNSKSILTLRTSKEEEGC